MSLTGGCYCGQLRYEAAGQPQMRIQCPCRECQHISGGAPNLVMGMPKDGFTWTKGKPTSFARDDLESPRIRDFCANCGTHVLTHSPPRPGMVMLKVGTLDDPDFFAQADAVIFTRDCQAWHILPNGVPAFDDMPG